jgi:hypothetical protein
LGRISFYHCYHLSRIAVVKILWAVFYNHNIEINHLNRREYFMKILNRTLAAVIIICSLASSASAIDDPLIQPHPHFRPIPAPMLICPGGEHTYDACTTGDWAIFGVNKKATGIGVKGDGYVGVSGSSHVPQGAGGEFFNNSGDLLRGLNTSGLVFRFDNTGNIFFGSQTRQMLNLWGSNYGIGVQNDAFYQRTANEFIWYKGGTHSNTFADPGSGGTQLMRLGNSGDLAVAGRIVTPVLQITGGADLAEPFQMTGNDIPMGAVVIIDENNPGKLKLTEIAYDKRVAGIVSGANGIAPGISLSQQGTIEGGQLVALSGRVYALGDAANSPIKPGDLLTTSETPGYVMKATESSRAQGAIVGKAMSALKEGKGVVLVLMSLQ